MKTNTEMKYNFIHSLHYAINIIFGQLDASGRFTSGKEPTE